MKLNSKLKGRSFPHEGNVLEGVDGVANWGLKKRGLAEVVHGGEGVVGAQIGDRTKPALEVSKMRLPNV